MRPVVWLYNSLQAGPVGPLKRFFKTRTCVVLRTSGSSACPLRSSPSTMSLSCAIEPEPRSCASDVAARYGGEEFVVLLPSTDTASAVRIAERIRQAVAAAPYALPGNESETITASIGIAGVTPDPGAEDLKTIGDALIARADVALYRAKSDGRNRVAVDQSE